MLGLVGSRCGAAAKSGLKVRMMMMIMMMMRIMMMMMKGVSISRWLSTSPYALSKIIYTECDEAPMLATFSLLPVIQRFAKPMGIEVSQLLSPISMKA